MSGRVGTRSEPPMAPLGLQGYLAPSGGSLEAGTPGLGVSVGLPNCHLGPSGRSLVPSSRTTEVTLLVVFPSLR